MASIFLYLLRPILYLLRFTRNLQYLQYEVRDGEEKMDEVREYIFEARWRGNYYDESEVEMWIQNLEKELYEAKKIFHESRYRHYNASSPNIISRYRLSKQAEKAAQEIAKCLDSDEAYSLFRVVDRPSSTKMVATKDILKVLEDEQVNTIGLYGITSSRMEVEVTRLIESAKERQLYRKIAILVMSRNYDLLEIQGELAAKIGLQLIGNVIENVSWLINERLTGMNKTLVIFEGVHEYFNLHGIGIPEGGCCKVVLTSIEERVCIEMGTQKNINMLELISLTFKDATEEWWQENEGLTYGPAIQRRLFQHGGTTTPDVEIGAANSSFTGQMQELQKGKWEWEKYFMG